MATNRVEAASKAAPETAKAKPESNGGGATEAGSGAKSGGVKVWLPLICNLVLMPVLAYATTMFVLVPKLKQAPASKEAPATGSSGGHDEHSKEKPSGGKESSEGEVVVPLSKILVNVAGTGGARYLMTSISLVGSGSDFPKKVEKKDAQLRDAASSTLCTKTIADLEKLGARNQIKSELVAAFEAVLGDGVVTKIYIPEWAIQ